MSLEFIYERYVRRKEMLFMIYLISCRMGNSTSSWSDVYSFSLKKVRIKNVYRWVEGKIKWRYIWTHFLNKIHLPYYLKYIYMLCGNKRMFMEIIKLHFFTFTYLGSSQECNIILSTVLIVRYKKESYWSLNLVDLLFHYKN